MKTEYTPRATAHERVFVIHGSIAARAALAPATALHAARAQRIAQLWVFADGAWPTLTAEQIAQLCDAGWEGTGGVGREAQAGDRWTHWFQRGQFGAIDLVFNTPGEMGTWGEAKNHVELDWGLRAFAREAGLPWRHSAGATAHRLMRALHNGRHGTPLELPCGQPPITQHSDIPIIWARPIRGEIEGMFLSSFDINGQFLAACSSLRLGVGEWTRAATHCEAELAPRDAPGYWHVLIPASGGTVLPIPIATGRREGTGGDYESAWISTPLMQLLREMGVNYWLDECYYWPEAHQYLTPWYKRLRDARAALRTPGPGHALALAAVKESYSLGVAWLAGRWKEALPDALYRPDWRHAVIAQARANEWRALWRQWAADCVTPVAIGADCAYWLHSDPNWQPTLRTGDGLGQWKAADGPIRLTDATREGAALLRVLRETRPGAGRVRLLQRTLNVIRAGDDPDAVWQRWASRQRELQEIDEMESMGGAQDE